MQNEQLIADINGRVAEKDLLKHPFYTDWNKGKLSIESLRGYARQYYKFVAMFPRFLSAIHSNCPDLETRQRILENLSEEEDIEKPHPVLWLDFCESLGLSRDDVPDAEPLPETEEAINKLDEICRNRSFLEGITALYAYESRVPEIARTKINGLENFYRITDEKALEFFRLHEIVDVWHADTGRELIEKHCVNAEDEAVVLSAADDAMNAMNLLLDGVYREYVACATVR